MICDVKCISIYTERNVFYYRWVIASMEYMFSLSLSSLLTFELIQEDGGGKESEN